MFNKVTFASALMVAVAFANDLSREGRNLSFVIGLNAPALLNPETNLNLAIDPK